MGQPHIGRAKTTSLTSSKFRSPFYLCSRGNFERKKCESTLKMLRWYLILEFSCNENSLRNAMFWSYENSLWEAWDHSCTGIGMLAPTVVLFFIFLMTLMMFNCIFLLMHLCYYIIVHGVYMERFLELLIILKCLNLWNIQNRAENLKFLKHNALIFDYICCASSELNHIFSVPVLILLTTKFVSVVTAAFIYIYYLIHSNSVLDNYSLLFPFLFFTEWIQMLILLTSADMPVNQVILLNTPHHFESY